MPKIHFITILLIILIVRLVELQAQNAIGFGNPTSTYQQTSNNSLRGNGLMFTENKGQFVDMNLQSRPDILFKACLPDVQGKGAMADVYLRTTGMSYVYSNIGEVMREVDEREEDYKRAGLITSVNEHEKRQALINSMPVKVHRVDMEFEGGNINTEMINEDVVEGSINYYYPQCPQGITNVLQYNKVTYKNIYNNIDVKYYGDKQRGIKYDLVVQPHADPNQIKLRWKGAESMHINSDGNLVIKTSVNEFYESIPKVYQIINGEIVDVKAKYRLAPRALASLSFGEGRGEDIVTFQLGTYNPEHTLIIDPVTWISYYGGSGAEGAASVATDGFGNAIFSGSTNSVNFPVSAGPYQAALIGAGDAFVVKMNSAGNRVFSTYFGGSGVENSNGVDADGNGDIYVTGSTSSVDLPTMAWAGAFMQSSFGGTNDAFVTKFSPVGLLIWSTYYGGNGSDTGCDLVTDALNNIIIIGNTASANLPILAAYQAVLNGSTDAFIMKFNNFGIRQWATYYGGSGLNENFPGGIAVDPANNIFICGPTDSPDFPVLSAFQPTLGGISDVFLCRLNSATGFPVWSTYFGGAAGEDGPFVAADALGNVFLECRTTSSGLGTPGTFQPVPVGSGTKVVVAKFTNTGTRVWGTYIGGSGTGGKTEEAGGIAVDVNNNIIVVGDTYNTDFPVTSCAYQTTFAGSEDQFITTFNQDGEVICSSFLGIGLPNSPNNETGTGGGSVAVSGGYLFMTANTACTYPVTGGAFQTLCGGSGEAAFSKLCIYSCGLPNTSANFVSPTSVCAGNPVNFTLNNSSCDTANTKYLWTFSGSTQGTSTLHDPGNITWASPGSYNVSVKIMTPCDTITVSKPSYITINNCGCTVSAAASVTTNVNCGSANSGSVKVTVNGGVGPYSYSWSNGSNGITTSTIIPLTGLSANNYTVTITDGACVSVSSFILSQPLAINAPGLTNVTCNGGNNGSASIAISGSTGATYTYSWSNGISSVTNSINNTVSNLAPGIYSVTVTQGSCSSIASVTITQPPTVVLGFSPKWFCTSNNGSATAIPSNGNPSYSYLWNNGQTGATASGLGAGTYSVTATDNFGCAVTGAVVIQYTPIVITTSSINISCTSAGRASVTVSSGIGPFAYTWSNGQIGSQNNFITPQPGVTYISGLSAGIYTITITDGSGDCSVTKTFNITGSSSVSATYTQTPASPVCKGSTVDFKNTGTTGAGVTHRWTIANTPIVSGSTVDISYTFLAAGTYNVNHIVTSGGCQGTIGSVVTVVDCSNGPSVTAIGNAVCSGNCLSLTANGSGGTPPYTFLWNTGETTKDINPCPTTTTTYTVTIKDAGGSTSTSTAVATVYPAVTVTTSPNNITCNGASTGSATATGSGGTLGYTYNWSNGATGISTGSMSVVNLTAGNYAVTVTDSKGCTSTSTATIVSPPPLLGQFSKGTANCTNCGCKEWVLVNGIGGTEPYTYTWPDGYGKRYKNKLCAGTYLVNIKDKNGCEVNVNISAP